MTLVKILFIITALIFLTADSFAQEQTKKQIQAVRTNEHISIDGILSESVWQGEGFSEFKQRHLQFRTAARQPVHTTGPLLRRSEP